MDEDRRRELEEVLSEPAEYPTFEAIRALVDTWPEREGRAEALATAQRALAAWPDTEREVELSWGDLEALLASPSWPLIRALRLEFMGPNIKPMLREGRLQRLFGRAELRTLIRLWLDAGGAGFCFETGGLTWAVRISPC